jgi:hypothetical protein
MAAHVSNGRFNLKTPRLETYEEETDLLEGPIHTDVSTVTQMRFIVKGSPSMSFSRCLGLKRLQIYDGGNHVINSVLDQLLADGGICLVLQAIELLGEYTNADIAPYLEKLSEINSRRAHPIDIAVLTEWSELPGASPDVSWSLNFVSHRLLIKWLSVVTCHALTMISPTSVPFPYPTDLAIRGDLRLRRSHL